MRIVFDATVFIDAMIATTISETISPYSMAVAPRRSRAKARHSLNIVLSPVSMHPYGYRCE
jgi:hypothetical protein